MKAITITQQLKDLNVKLFQSNLVGSIKALNLPKSFYRPVNNGARTDMYPTLNNSLHEVDGFYDLITPVYDSAIEKLGDIYFDIDHFIYTITALTQDEIDAKVAKEAKDEFKNNLEGVFNYATTPDGTKEYAIKIGNDGKIVTVLIP